MLIPEEFHKSWRFNKPISEYKSVAVSAFFECTPQVKLDRVEYIDIVDAFQEKKAVFLKILMKFLPK